MLTNYQFLAEKFANKKKKPYLCRRNITKTTVRNDNTEYQHMALASLGIRIVAGIAAIACTHTGISKKRLNANAASLFFCILEGSIMVRKQQRN